jgi:hypothetical protein
MTMIHINKLVFGCRTGAAYPHITALVIHRETDKAYQCSANGTPLRGIFGWLPKKAVHVMHREGPFMVASGRKRLFSEKHLGNTESAILTGEWTDEQKAMWARMCSAAARERSAGRKKPFDRTNGRDQYA